MKISAFTVSSLTVPFVLLFTAYGFYASDAAASTFVIASTVGYGVEDCLAEGGECGRVVADAWCEAHGRGAALTFGQQTEPGAPTSGPRPYFITCAE